MNPESVHSLCSDSIAQVRKLAQDWDASDLFCDEFDNAVNDLVMHITKMLQGALDCKPDLISDSNNILDEIDARSLTVMGLINDSIGSANGLEREIDDEMDEILDLLSDLSWNVQSLSKDKDQASGATVSVVVADAEEISVILDREKVMEKLKVLKTSDKFRGENVVQSEVSSADNMMDIEMTSPLQLRLDEIRSQIQSLSHDCATNVPSDTVCLQLKRNSNQVILFSLKSISLIEGQDEAEIEDFYGIVEDFRDTTKRFLSLANRICLNEGKEKERLKDEVIDRTDELLDLLRSLSAIPTHSTSSSYGSLLRDGDSDYHSNSPLLSAFNLLPLRVPLFRLGLSDDASQSSDSNSDDSMSEDEDLMKQRAEFMEMFGTSITDMLEQKEDAEFFKLLDRTQDLVKRCDDAARQGLYTTKFIQHSLRSTVTQLVERTRRTIDEFLEGDARYIRYDLSDAIDEIVSHFIGVSYRLYKNHRNEETLREFQSVSVELQQLLDDLSGEKEKEINQRSQGGKKKPAVANQPSTPQPINTNIPLPVTMGQTKDPVPVETKPLVIPAEESPTPVIQPPQHVPEKAVPVDAMPSHLNSTSQRHRRSFREIEKPVNYKKQEQEPVVYNASEQPLWIKNLMQRASRRQEIISKAEEVKNFVPEWQQKANRILEKNREFTVEIKEHIPDARAKNSNKKERRVSKVNQQARVVASNAPVQLTTLRQPSTVIPKATYRGEQPDLSKNQPGVTLKIQKKNWFAMAEGADAEVITPKRKEEEEAREREEKQKQLAKMESMLVHSNSSTESLQKAPSVNPFTVQSPKQRRLMLEQGRDEEINAITNRAKEQLAQEKNEKLEKEREDKERIEREKAERAEKEHLEAERAKKNAELEAIKLAALTNAAQSTVTTTASTSSDATPENNSVATIDTKLLIAEVASDNPSTPAPNTTAQQALNPNLNPVSEASSVVVPEKPMPPVTVAIDPPRRVSTKADAPPLSPRSRNIETLFNKLGLPEANNAVAVESGEPVPPVRLSKLLDSVSNFDTSSLATAAIENAAAHEQSTPVEVKSVDAPVVVPQPTPIPETQPLLPESLEPESQANESPKTIEAPIETEVTTTPVLTEKVNAMNEDSPVTPTTPTEVTLPASEPQHAVRLRSTEVSAPIPSTVAPPVAVVVESNAAVPEKSHSHRSEKRNPKKSASSQNTQSSSSTTVAATSTESTTTATARTKTITSAPRKVADKRKGKSKHKDRHVSAAERKAREKREQEKRRRNLVIYKISEVNLSKFERLERKYFRYLKSQEVFEARVNRVKTGKRKSERRFHWKGNKEFRIPKGARDGEDMTLAKDKIKLYLDCERTRIVHMKHNRVFGIRCCVDDIGLRQTQTAAYFFGSLCKGIGNPLGDIAVRERRSASRASFRVSVSNKLNSMQLQSSLLAMQQGQIPTVNPLAQKRLSTKSPLTNTNAATSTNTATKPQAQTTPSLVKFSIATRPNSDHANAPLSMSQSPLSPRMGNQRDKSAITFGATTVARPNSNNKTNTNNSPEKPTQPPTTTTAATPSSATTATTAASPLSHSDAKPGKDKHKEGVKAEHGVVSRSMSSPFLNSQAKREKKLVREQSKGSQVTPKDKKESKFKDKDTKEKDKHSKPDARAETITDPIAKSDFIDNTGSPDTVKEKDAGGGLLNFRANVASGTGKLGAREKDSLKNSREALRPRPATTDNSDYTPPSISMLSQSSSNFTAENEKSPRTKQLVDSEQQLSPRSRAKSSNLVGSTEGTNIPNSFASVKNTDPIARSVSSGEFTRRGQFVRSATVCGKPPEGATNAANSFAFSTFNRRDSPNSADSPKFQTTRARFGVTNAPSATNTNSATSTSPNITIPDVINMDIISEVKSPDSKTSTNVDEESTGESILTNAASNRKMQMILQSEEKRHRDDKDLNDAKEKAEPSGQRVHVRRRPPVRSMTETGTNPDQRKLVHSLSSDNLARSNSGEAPPTGKDKVAAAIQADREREEKRKRSKGKDSLAGTGKMKINITSSNLSSSGALSASEAESSGGSGTTPTTAPNNPFPAPSPREKLSASPRTPTTSGTPPTTPRLSPLALPMLPTLPTLPSIPLSNTNILSPSPTNSPRTQQPTRTLLHESPRTPHAIHDSPRSLGKSPRSKSSSSGTTTTGYENLSSSGGSLSASPTIPKKEKTKKTILSASPGSEPKDLAGFEAKDVEAPKSPRSKSQGALAGSNPPRTPTFSSTKLTAAPTTTSTTTATSPTITKERTESAGSLTTSGSNRNPSPKKEIVPLSSTLPRKGGKGKNSSSGNMKYASSSSNALSGKPERKNSKGLNITDMITMLSVDALLDVTPPSSPKKDDVANPESVAEQNQESTRNSSSSSDVKATEGATLALPAILLNEEKEVSESPAHEPISPVVTEPTAVKRTESAESHTEILKKPPDAALVVENVNSHATSPTNEGQPSPTALTVAKPTTTRGRRMSKSSVRSTLFIQIINGKNLVCNAPDTQKAVPSNPYLYFVINTKRGTKIKRSAIVYDDANPVWNQNLEIEEPIFPIHCQCLNKDIQESDNMDIVDAVVGVFSITQKDIPHPDVPCKVEYKFKLPSNDETDAEKPEYGRIYLELLVREITSRS